MNKKSLLIIGIIIVFGIIAYMISFCTNTQEESNLKSNKLSQVENYYLKNPNDIKELKTTNSINTDIQIYKDRFNNGIPNSSNNYDYTIKDEDFSIASVLVDCELIKENNIQYIKLPYWFTRYFEISEKIQLDKKYDTNTNNCILELVNVYVERQDEYDIWKIESFNIYEQEKAQIDYQIKCIGEYFNKTIKTDSIPNVN